MKRLLWWLILVIIFFRLLGFWNGQRVRFFSTFDPEYFGQLYSQSQYVLGEKSTGGIGDDGLYAFAGYYYFFQKGDVSSVNFEHPPLGKYLIGLSIFLFHNENFINIIYFLCLLFTTYKLSGIFLKDKLFSLLPVLLLSSDPLFLDHSIRSQLDLPFTLFFSLGIYFFIKGENKSKFIYLSQLFWAAAFASRFFPFLVVIELFMFCITFIYQRNNIFVFIKSLMIIPMVYLIVHLSFFIYHPSLIEFLRHKKWMLAWFTGTPVITGNILRNIFSGLYLDSTDKLTLNKLWTPLLPVVTVLALGSFRGRYFLKRMVSFIIFYGINLIYLLYLVFLTNGLQKFIMPVYPILIILAIQNLKELYSIIRACVIGSFNFLRAK